MTRRKHGFPEAPAPSADPDAWWEPITAEAPAGPWLEYDTAYAALGARMMPSVEVQYGDFRQRRDAPAWPELERECRDLLRRSRDITLLVWWLRCRVHACGADGLEQGLRVMQRVLQALSAHVHPQIQVEGETDPAVRANSLAALADPETLLADVRDVVAFGSGGEARTVRDVERAEAGDDAARQESRARLLRAWRDGDARCLALHRANQALHDIASWAGEHLGPHAPDLGALQRLLEVFAEPDLTEGPMAGVGQPPSETDSSSRAPDPAAEPRDEPRVAAAQRERTEESKESEEAVASCGALGSATPPRDRDGAQACIAEARRWFELHEPSSPVSVLLRQAERLVGKRYAEVAQAIPPDLLARWDAS